MIIATSGLDASTALSVVKSITDLAKSQNLTIVTVLHQPRNSIFQQMDNVLVLSNFGTMVYYGSPKMTAETLQLHNLKPPPDETIADFVMDICMTDTEKLMSLHNATVKYLEEQPSTVHPYSYDDDSFLTGSMYDTYDEYSLCPAHICGKSKFPGFFLQVWICMRRSAIHRFRDPRLMVNYSVASNHNSENESSGLYTWRQLYCLFS